MKKCVNEMKLVIESRSVNERFARVAVCGFIASLDPTVDIMSDIKTAVSEAVTNCIVHAYKDKIGKIYITLKLFEDGTVRIIIRDRGCGIENVEKAKEPLFTTAGDERAGLGFAVMENFSDKLKVRSTLGKGTTVTLEKQIPAKER